MSRSQKNVRRVPAGSPKPETTQPSKGYPDVTQMDSAKNIAGDVTAFSSDQYTTMKPFRECCD